MPSTQQTTAGADGNVTKTGLARAVLSSCADRPLGEMIAEVREISDVGLFDLLILREIDIEEIGRQLGPLTRPTPNGDVEAVTSTHYLAVEANLDKITQWLVELLKNSNLKYGNDKSRWNRISALATFFPEVTSRSGEPDPTKKEVESDSTPRNLAIRALANTVRLALRLKEHGLLGPSCWDRTSAIVEMVCGTIPDRCQCEWCRKLRQAADSEYAVISTEAKKYDLLCEALGRVVEEVGKHEGKRDDDWALAMELEPGPAYVLKDTASIEAILAKLNQIGGDVARHIGLNLDIAHMKIAEVAAIPKNSHIDEKTLEQFEDRIVHAHICDHPGMHTRDQVVGVWNPVEQCESEDYDYLRLLRTIARSGPRSTGLPFSGTVALELEGCSRIGWIHRSLVAMKHMFAVVEKLP